MRNKTKKLDILKTKTGLAPKELKPLISRKKPIEVYVTFPSNLLLSYLVLGVGGIGIKQGLEGK